MEIWGFLNGDLMEFHGIVMGGSPKVADPWRGVDLGVPPWGNHQKMGNRLEKTWKTFGTCGNCGNCGSGAGICCPPDPPRLGAGSAQRPWGLTARPRWNKWWRARRPVWSPGSGAGVAGRDNLAWHLLKYFLFFDLGFWRHFKLDYQVGFLIPHLNPAGGISAVKFDWGGDADTKKPVHQPAPNSPSEWKQIIFHQP